MPSRCLQRVIARAGEETATVDRFRRQVIGATALLPLLFSPGIAAEDATWQPLETQAAYAVAVAGRMASLTTDDVVFTKRAGGTFDGHIRGVPWSGTWTMRKGYVCYQGIEGERTPTYGCARAAVSTGVLRLEFALNAATLFYDLSAEP